jgi:anti-anti-sigma regulatory factor
MQVRFLEEGERLIARPEARMEAADGIDFASAVEQRIQRNTKFVTIDLEGLDFISLGGIRAILRLARSLRGGQRDLDFRRGSDAVREALHHAGLNNFFDFTPPYIHTGGHQR